jgi:thiol:disulfide interchange protein DsbD
MLGGNMMMENGGSKKSGILVSVIVCLLLITGASANVSDQIPKEPIKWALKAALPDKPLKAGDKFTLQLTASIEPRWHLYSTDQAEGGPTPTRIAMPSEQPFEQDGAIESSEPKVAMDPNFNLMTQYYEEQAIFVIPVKVAAKPPTGKSEVKVTVSFQTCNDELCLPPKTVKLAVAVDLVAAR